MEGRRPWQLTEENSEMVSQYVILTAVGVLVTSSSAFVLSTSSYSRNSGRMQEHYECDKESSAIFMKPREAKAKFREESSGMMKQMKNKKSYNVPGYVKGNHDLIRSVFRIHSIDGEMTYTAFLDSKYLRYWPGTSLISHQMIILHRRFNWQH